MGRRILLIMAIVVAVALPVVATEVIKSGPTTGSALTINTGTQTIRGGISVESGTTGTDSSPEGQWFLCTGACTRTLPAITASGQSICYYALTAAIITVSPNSADQIRLNGTLGAADKDITGPATAGSTVCLMSRDNADDDEWIVTSRTNTWGVES
jgi:hypothetical protein